jgi:hypothetical protein
MDFLYFWQDLVAHKVEIVSTLGGLGGIYMFVNCVNGKSYIGSTNSTISSGDSMNIFLGQIRTLFYRMLLLNMDGIILPLLF